MSSSHLEVSGIEVHMLSKISNKQTPTELLYTFVFALSFLHGLKQDFNDRIAETPAGEIDRNLPSLLWKTEDANTCSCSIWSAFEGRT